MKKVFVIVLCLIMSFLIGCNNQDLNDTKNNEEVNNTTSGNQASEFNGQRGNRGNGGQMGQANKSTDEVLQSILAEVESKYQQLEFQDSETGITLAYNLFVPENYDESKEYPLILFMTDSSVVGKNTTAALEQGYGGVIWATSGEQAKHECFVLVPEYSRTIVDDNSETTNDVIATVNLLNSLTQEYKIDKNRIYTTGQSMGGMTSIYLLKTYPDLFAGALLVACQWDTTGLEVLKDQNIFYIVGAGDTKASPGQNAIREALENVGAKVSTATWDATWNEEEYANAVSSILSEGHNLNFVKFEEGTVLTANPVSNMEHMASFDPAYKINGVRDWLFQQSK
ncbi:MAG: prolyl oligopeptidase family serine peptidase [Clostridia bacterium]|nr:prolyl oligopeptidase family serine peptidase [Clostridia bacterium]